MSLNVPIAVRIKTSRTDRDITNQIDDLRYRHAVPRGFGSCTMSFHRPLRFRPDEVDYFAEVWVYDTRNGQTLFYGILEDPERVSGLAGEVWGLTAIGPAAFADDQTIPLIYVDRSLSRWMRIEGNTTSTFLTTAQDQKVITDPGWRLQFGRGAVVPVADHGGITYRAIQDAGQKIARVSYAYDVDNADVNWHHKLYAYDSGGGAVSDVQFSSGDGSLSKVVGTDWINGRTRPEIGLSRTTGSVTITDDVTRVWLTGIAVRAMLVDVTGTDITTGYTLDTIKAEEVVRDLLGRLLTMYDGANAKIATSVYGIDQLAWPDGIKPSGVLTELMRLVPDTFWAVWEKQANGKHRFEWSKWPTSIDYDATTFGGFSSPGSSVDIYNRVNVRYRTPDGQIAMVTRTQTVPLLSNAGRTRTAFIDLGDEPGTAANAAQAGDLFLAQHLYPPNRGTLVVDRPIVSRGESRMVSPQELRPGRLLLAQNIEPTVDALNTTARNGVSVFRVVSVEYTAGSNTATLELDSYARSSDRGLADILSSPVLDQRRR